MAVDYGDARTGLASCDAGEMLAVPAGVLHEWDRDKLMRQIIQQAEILGVEEIVVGLPKNMDGSEGERAEKCRDFALHLALHSGIETKLWDERCTTQLAHRTLNATNTRGAKRKAVVDEVAATIILQDYLDHRRLQHS